MKVKLVGDFYELPHGDKNGASLRESISSEPHPDESQIIQYLKKGVVWIVCGGLTKDVLDESSTFVICPNILTDGTWAWYADLAYYVEKYHVHLSDEFIRHMRVNNWVVPAENIDVLTLEF